MIACTEIPLFFRPRLVVAEGNSAQAALLCRQFRRLGWEVHLASSGPDARRLARLLEPQLVILDTALREESGWLTCAKLTLENEELEVILLDESATECQRQFAQFVGASALVTRDGGVPALVAEVHEAAGAQQD